MSSLEISDSIIIPKDEIEFTAVRSQGAGGQHVNKVATGIHLRFDIVHSTLPDNLKQRLLQLADHRINKDGILIIKSQRSRSQEQNKNNALETLIELIQAALVEPKARRKTRPSKGSITRRIERKKIHGKIKELRQRIPH
ncbi:MAG: alternative ribosome rescue aminoacyl-tRNA hydrolase ArfB [Deltaproteobacteria bacterium]|nr:alternative ribosome rescue aminoacyl-tRNA hydrolase ArfB [Deltaproteobacteria bacterium]